MLEIITKKDGIPYAVVGAKSLQENEYFSLHGKTGIDVVCPVCGFPFAVSMQKHGRINDVVVCFNCEKSACTIQEEKEEQEEKENEN